MADETNTGSVAGAAETDTAAKPVIRKQRAPRRGKAIAEAAPAGSPSVTELPPTASAATVDGRGRRGKRKAAETKVVDGRSARKGAPRKTTAKPVEAAATSAPAFDELEDLIQLEEENKRLRKTLAEKLRQENAELRRRLGVG
ncbi:SyrB2 regulator [Rhizobium sp. F40D2]|uniref:SyrB2 regulator n=1 Tax=Rhizobium sp. F40D2 TaxID=3453141 RepID=UPI003F286550